MTGNIDKRKPEPRNIGLHQSKAIARGNGPNFVPRMLHANDRQGVKKTSHSAAIATFGLAALNYSYSFFMGEIHGQTPKIRSLTASFCPVGIIDA